MTADHLVNYYDYYHCVCMFWFDSFNLSVYIRLSHSVSLILEFSSFIFELSVDLLCKMRTDLQSEQ